METSVNHEDETTGQETKFKFYDMLENGIHSTSPISSRIVAANDKGNGPFLKRNEGMEDMIRIFQQLLL